MQQNQASRPGCLPRLNAAVHGGRNATGCGQATSLARGLGECGLDLFGGLELHDLRLEGVGVGLRPLGDGLAGAQDARRGDRELLHAPADEQRPVDPNSRQAVSNSVAQSDAEGYAQTCEAIAGMDHKDPEYSVIRAPALLIVGDMDVISM